MPASHLENYGKNRKRTALVLAVFALSVMGAGYVVWRWRGRKAEVNCPPTLAASPARCSLPASPTQQPETDVEEIILSPRRHPAVAKGPRPGEKTPAAPAADSTQLAHLQRGDQLWAAYVEGSVAKEHWDEIAAAYSAALGEGRLPEAEKEEQVVQRLVRLNQSLLFGDGKPSAPEVKFYLVQPGDVLERVGRAQGCPWRRIARSNGLQEPWRLRVGQTLRLIHGAPLVVIDKTRLKASLFMSGRFVGRWDCGVGKDDKTPSGTFKIANQLINPVWWFEGHSIPPDDPRNILGTRWLGFEPSGAGAGLGIHGSRDGQGVPGRESLGCIRLHNRDVEVLYDWITVGTPVKIVD